MKAKSKNNSNTFQGWLEAQLWNASLQPRSMVGAGNAVKGRDQLRCASPLTAFPAQCPRLSRFSLDTAVVVIDGMTFLSLWALSTWTHCGLPHCATEATKESGQSQKRRTDKNKSKFLVRQGELGM